MGTFTQQEIDSARERAYTTLNYYEVVDSYKYKSMNERMDFMLKIRAEFLKELVVPDNVERTFHLTKLKLQDLKQLLLT